jgi:hypothetical protein
MWASLCLMGSSSFSGTKWLAWLSPLFTAHLLINVTGIKMVQSAGMKKWGHDPAYLHYMNHTQKLMLGRPAPPFNPTFASGSAAPTTHTSSGTSSTKVGFDGNSATSPKNM